MQDFDKLVGAPGNRTQEREEDLSCNQAKVRLPVDPAESTEIVTCKGVYTRIRLRIKKKDLGKFGYTAACPG